MTARPRRFGAICGNGAEMHQQTGRAFPDRPNLPWLIFRFALVYLALLGLLTLLDRSIGIPSVWLESFLSLICLATATVAVSYTMGKRRGARLPPAIMWECTMVLFLTLLVLRAVIELIWMSAITRGDLGVVFQVLPLRISSIEFWKVALVNFSLAFVVIWLLVPLASGKGAKHPLRSVLD